ncbi:Uncharacterised protein [Mycoplasmopsis californica]|uniref:Lipoprotein 17-related variable surface protein n=1 Tax=Mycoplasmopsis equigenitalium TaxID=114883 RepID=A0ABY5J133_9BACT|nr:lipoprotein 17-related variable surface protein [Mycoplasmopsis equigenitalium]UUD36690.1 lipoprotein 17-related variable surface protein [Mycoplasmopsis equigenitalium]VEU69347.1 Uncharacterised protein [Mycoplasmopsis californica]
MNKTKLLLATGIAFTLATTATVATYGVLHRKDTKTNTNTQTSEPSVNNLIPTPIYDELKAVLVNASVDKIISKDIMQLDSNTTPAPETLEKGKKVILKSAIEAYKKVYNESVALTKEQGEIKAMKQIDALKVAKEHLEKAIVTGTFTPTPELDALRAYIKQAKSEINLEYIHRYDKADIVEPALIPLGTNAAPFELVEEYNKALAAAEKVTENELANAAKSVLESALNKLKKSFIPGTDDTYLRNAQGMFDFDTLLDQMNYYNDYNRFLLVDLEIIDIQKMHPSTSALKLKDYNMLNELYIQAKQAYINKNEAEFKRLYLKFNGLNEIISYSQLISENIYMEPFKYNVPIPGEGDERDVNAALTFYKDGVYLKEMFPDWAEKHKNFDRKELFRAMYGAGFGTYLTAGLETEYGTTQTYKVISYDNEKGIVRLQITCAKGTVSKTKEITISGFFTKEQDAKNKLLAEKITKREFDKSPAWTGRVSGIMENYIMNENSPLDTVAFLYSDLSRELESYLTTNNLFLLKQEIRNLNPKVDNETGTLKFTPCFVDKKSMDWTRIEITIVNWMTNAEFLDTEVVVYDAWSTSSRDKKASEIKYDNIDTIMNEYKDCFKNIEKDVIVSIVPGSEINDDTKGTKTLTIKLVCGKASKEKTVTITDFKRTI